AFGPDSVLTNPTFTLSAAPAGRTKKRIAIRNSLLMVSARLPADLHRGIDYAPVLDDLAPVQLHRAVAHRHVVVPARIALASALAVRPRGVDEVAGQRSHRRRLAHVRVALRA